MWQRFELARPTLDQSTGANGSYVELREADITEEEESQSPSNDDTNNRATGAPAPSYYAAQTEERAETKPLCPVGETAVGCFGERAPVVAVRGNAAVLYAAHDTPPSSPSTVALSTPAAALKTPSTPPPPTILYSSNNHSHSSSSSAPKPPPAARCTVGWELGGAFVQQKHNPAPTPSKELHTTADEPVWGEEGWSDELSTAINRALTAAKEGEEEASDRDEDTSGTPLLGGGSSNALPRQPHQQQRVISNSDRIAASSSVAARSSAATGGAGAPSFSRRFVTAQRWQAGSQTHNSFDCSRSSLAVPPLASVAEQQLEATPAPLSNSCSSLELTRTLAARRNAAAFLTNGIGGDFTFRGAARLRTPHARKRSTTNVTSWSRQSSTETEPVDLCQIGRSFMRVNGTLNRPFRHLLSHADSLPSSAAGGGRHNASSTADTALVNLDVVTPTAVEPRHRRHTGEKQQRETAFHSDQSASSAAERRRPPLVRAQTEAGYNTAVVDDASIGERGVSLTIIAKAESAVVEGVADAAGGGEDGAEEKDDDDGTPNIKTAVSQRLVVRQALYAKRRRTCDISLFFALLGIALMIAESEFTAADVYSKSSVYSYVGKTLIVISTCLLLITIMHFHFLEIQLFMNDNSAEDWRIAMTSRRVTQIMVELTLCAICPIPGDFTFSWTTIHADGQTVTTTEVPTDVLLSLPMFARLYLICRTMLLHSRLFTDASSRSIGALNRVNFNARFILKTLMTLCPGTVLLVFTASLWVIAAWVLRLCERYHVGHPPNVQAVKHQNYLNSLWLIAITFLSVGYGDIVPNTYCGRGVAVCTGIMGVCTSSLVVAVIARKLELTRAEKHVHNFMMDTQLTKRIKHAAANVLRETWLIYRNRRLVEKIEASKIRQHQRKFLLAIYELRQIRCDQRKLQENSWTMGDIAKTSQSTYELVSDVQEAQTGLDERMAGVEERLEAIGEQLTRLTQQLATTATSTSDLPPAYAHSSALARRRRAMLVAQASDDPSVRSEPPPSTNAARQHQ